LGGNVVGTRCDKTVARSHPLPKTGEKKIKNKSMRLTKNIAIHTWRVEQKKRGQLLRFQSLLEGRKRTRGEVC